MQTRKLILRENSDGFTLIRFDENHMSGETIAELSNVFSGRLPLFRWLAKSAAKYNDIQFEDETE